MRRMFMRRLAMVTLAGAFVLTACGGDNGTPAPSVEGPVAFSEVLATAYSSVVQPRQVAVNDADTWAALWSEHASNVMAQPRPHVDFSTQTVAALFSGVSSGCQRAEVQAIAVTSAPSVRVTYRVSEPSNSSACAAAMTTPAHVVRFDNPARLPVEFRLAGGLGAEPPLLGATVGGDCFTAGCRADDAATLGGSCYGYYCGAGYAGNSGGNCVGDGCQAGNGNTVGGNCYGARCKAGNAWNSGGNCYGEGCTPGHGGTMSGTADATPRNTACILGEIYQFHTTGVPWLTNWTTPVGAACRPVEISWYEKVQILPVQPPSSAPAPVVITPLPSNPWDPANLPKCPYTCQAYNPASGSCVGAPMNAC